MKYQEVTMFQGEEANKVINSIESLFDNYEEAVKYLSKWDDGKGNIYNSPQHCSSDYMIFVGEYRLSWNNGMNCVYLEKCLRIK